MSNIINNSVASAITETITKAIADGGISRGKVFKACAERCEALQVTITSSLKNTIYAEIDREFKTVAKQVINSKDNIVTGLKHKVSIKSGELSYGYSMQLTDTKERPLDVQMRDATNVFDATVKACRKSGQWESGISRVRAARNLIYSLSTQLRLTLVPENITLAENHEKYVNKVYFASVPVDSMSDSEKETFKKMAVEQNAEAVKVE